MIAQPHRPTAAAGLLAALLLADGNSDAHRMFGDRDAGHPSTGPRVPAGCGLFGRLADAPPLVPSNHPLAPAHIAGEEIRTPLSRA